MTIATATLDRLRFNPLVETAVHHPFLQAISAGRVDTFTMAHVMRAYAAYSARFPELVNALFEHPMDSGTRCLIETVLDEERADPAGVSHAELLSRTADSLGVGYDPDLLATMCTETLGYANLVESTVKAGLGHALGALGPATEWIVPRIYESFVGWWQHRAPSTATDQFFAFHVDSDEVHAELFEGAVVLSVSTGMANLPDVEEGCRQALSARVKLWDRLMGLQLSRKAAGLESSSEVGR